MGGGQGMEDMAEQLKGMFSQMGGGKRTTRKLKVAEALKLLVDEEASKLLNEDEIKASALANAQEMGIVFIDEIDKVASRSEQAAPTCRARACSATCCRWSRAPRSTPSTAWSRPTTSSSSPRAPSTSASRAT